MSQIRNKNTKPEMIVRKFLHASGFRYKLHVKDLPGKPDIVLPKYRTIIFVHGCFWHRHSNCKFATVPTSNLDYWTPKLEKNILNDNLNIKKLKEDNWRVIVIWECELKRGKIDSTLKRLISNIVAGERI